MLSASVASNCSSCALSRPHGDRDLSWPGSYSVLRKFRTSFPRTCREGVSHVLAAKQTFKTAAVLRGVAGKHIIDPSVANEFGERLHAEACEIEKAHRMIPAKPNELTRVNLRARQNDLCSIIDAIVPTQKRSPKSELP